MLLRLFRAFPAAWLLAGGLLDDPGHAAEGSFQSPGTRRMASRLEEIIRADGPAYPFAYQARIEQMEGVIPGLDDASQRLPLLVELAQEQLRAGDPEKSLAALRAFAQQGRGGGVNLAALDRRKLLHLQAAAFLRLGEFENCLAAHQSTSCLLPIAENARHRLPRGSLNAQKSLEQALQASPRDVLARWLYNVAAMTLGQWPGDVPEPWRIPARVFQSEHPLPRMPEIGAALGVAVQDIAGGILVDDFDGDRRLDVILSSWHLRGPCRFFRNRGDGRFEERTAAAGFTGVTGGLNLMQADYDNDGWLDFYLVRGAWAGERGRHPDSLLRNNGDGTFSDVTEETGLYSLHPALSATWFDANNDGWVDLFVGNETTDPAHPHPCQLFLNQGGRRFLEAAVPSGLAWTANVKGVTAGDYDDDGWTDLYVSALGQPNRLYRNLGRAGAEGGWAFVDVTGKAGVAEPRESFPTWFWDYDQDGRLDLFVSGYSQDFELDRLAAFVADKLGEPSSAERPRLYRNRGDGTFENVTSRMRLDRALYGMGANFGDFDNDGWLDFYVGTGDPTFSSLLPNEARRNDGGRGFQDVTTATGTGHLQKGHGVAFADLNDDGAQELLVNVGGAVTGDHYPDAVFANPGGTNAWVHLRLQGTRANRAALGARVRVIASGPDGRREFHRVVSPGGSFGSGPLRIELGLGSCRRLETVEVRWPGNPRAESFTGLAPGALFHLVEGRGRAERQELPPFALPAAR